MPSRKDEPSMLNIILPRAASASLQPACHKYPASQLLGLADAKLAKLYVMPLQKFPGFLGVSSFRGPHKWVFFPVGFPSIQNNTNHTHTNTHLSTTCSCSHGPSHGNLRQEESEKASSQKSGWRCEFGTMPRPYQTFSPRPD